MAVSTDVKEIAVSMLKGSSYLITKDLESLPEDAFDKSFGPACRTVADLIYEVNMVNDHVGLTVRGEERFAWPTGWIKAPEDFRTKEVVTEAFKKSIEKMIATAESYSEAEMLVTISDGEGGETNRYERFRFVSLHNWYHSGQLNYIQTLLGDDGWHW